MLYFIFGIVFIEIDYNNTKYYTFFLQQSILLNHFYLIKYFTTYIFMYLPDILTTRKIYPLLSLCLTASYVNTVQATAALSDSTSPCIGI